MIARHVAFVSSSFEYTRGIMPFARRLEARGYIVDWISFRGFERRWLLQQGVPAEKILDTLSGLGDDLSDEEIDACLHRLENGRQPFVNHILSMDRLVKRKSAAFGRRYLARIEKSLTRFLVSRGVTLVSGGRDTALQIATSKICDRLGIPFIVPTAVRIPDDRYGFCLGYTEARQIELRPPTAADRAAAEEFLRHFREVKPVPSAVLFESRNNQFLRRIPSDIGLWTTMARRGRHDRGNDFTRYTVGRLLDMYWRRRWNALVVKTAPPFEQPGRKPFVIYAYQMQPESGIDVLAAHYSDQITLIRQIARAVPSTHDFYVKPHPDHVGGLPRARMVEIARIPGVTLIDPFANGRDLMHRAALITTPAGTMAYEAALYGIPSIIFADEFFRRLPGVHVCESIAALPALVAGILERPRQVDDDAILEYLARLFANTVVGRVTDYLGPLTDSELSIMEEAYDDLYTALWQPAAAPALDGRAARS